MGPRGPLVRFDQSALLLLPLSRAEAGLRRPTPASGGSSRPLEGGDGSARLGRFSRWSRGRQWWKKSSAVSFAAEGGFGAKWLRGGGGSRSKWSRGKVYGRMRGFLVERTKSGRPWWCRIGRGSGGGCRCRRWGRRPSPSRFAAMGELGEHSKASCVHGVARGPPFIARRGRFRGGRISSPANRLAVACRATWRGWG